MKQFREISWPIFLPDWVITWDYGCQVAPWWGAERRKTCCYQVIFLGPFERVMNQHSDGLRHISTNFTRLRSLKLINIMIQRLGTEILKMMIILRSLRDLRRRGKRVFRCHLVVGGAGRRAGHHDSFENFPAPTQISSEPKLFLLWATKSRILPDFNVKSITGIPLHNIWVLTFDCEGFQIELNYKVNGKLSLKQRAEKLNILQKETD